MICWNADSVILRIFLRSGPTGRNIQCRWREPPVPEPRNPEDPKGRHKGYFIHWLRRTCAGPSGLVQFGLSIPGPLRPRQRVCRPAGPESQCRIGRREAKRIRLRGDFPGRLLVRSVERSLKNPNKFEIRPRGASRPLRRPAVKTPHPRRRPVPNRKSRFPTASPDHATIPAMPSADADEPPVHASEC